MFGYVEIKLKTNWDKRCGEKWKSIRVVGSGEMRREVGRCGEMRGDVRRCGGYAKRTRDM